MFRKASTFLIGVVILSLVASACAQPSAPLVDSPPEAGAVIEEAEAAVTPTPVCEERKLEIFHWWTAGGEQEAADAMFTAFCERCPAVEVVENPVSGGGGVSHRVVLQGRLEAGIPPDTFQTLGGAELKSYVDEGYMMPLDDLYAELGYKDVIPRPLANAATIDRHPYVIPLNMHAQNILYYDVALFDELGLAPPATYDQLLAAAADVKAAYPEMAPLALGTEEKWGAAFVFDSILLEAGGPQYYVDFYKGKVDVETDPIFKDALAKLEALIPYLYPEAEDLTWDASCGLVTSGDSAMVLMGTWGIGYFKSQGWEPGVDFNAVTFPQEPDRVLLFHPDTYGLAKGAPHPETTLDWLRVVASPALQVPTDVAQGGLFARVDIDPAVFPDPIRQELQRYINTNPDKLILDQHGSIAPLSFTEAYWDVIVDFIVAPDVDATVNAVADMFLLYDVRAQASWYVWP